jgi:hypothetical protein
MLERLNEEIRRRTYVVRILAYPWPANDGPWFICLGRQKNGYRNSDPTAFLDGRPGYGV